MVRLAFICLPIFVFLIFLWSDEENPLVKLLALVVVAGFISVMIYLGRLGGV